MTPKVLQKRNIALIGLSLLAVLLLTTILFKQNDNYHIDRFVPTEFQDTLLVDIVTYMGVKPKHANWETRHLSEYRNFYIQQAADFNIHKYHVDSEGIHHFYMIRPARHPLGNRRAIGGRMQLSEDFRITEYKELFVTQVLEEEKLRQIAPELFSAMINNELEERLQNRQIIEWPDDRLKFDPIKKEWRYDVMGNR